MTTIGTLILLGVLGGVHGFVVWKLVFRLVRPIARLIVRGPGPAVPVSEGLAHLVVLVFLLLLALVLLQGLGDTFVPRMGGKEKFGALLLGSMCGLFLLGAGQRVERGLRRRMGRPR